MLLQILTLYTLFPLSWVKFDELTSFFFCLSWYWLENYVITLLWIHECSVWICKETPRWRHNVNAWKLTFSTWPSFSAFSGPPLETTTVKSDERPDEKSPNTTRPTKNQTMANAFAWSDLGVRSPYLKWHKREIPLPYFDCKAILAFLSFILILPQEVHPCYI